MITPTVREPPDPGEYRMGTDRKESPSAPAARSAELGCRDAMIDRPSRKTIDVIVSGSSGASGPARPSSPTSAATCNAPVAESCTHSEPRLAPITSRTSERIAAAALSMSSVEPRVSLME
ncbi:MAG: hypothetical protein AMS19_07925 [Gemmatimonas sp. SG8_23]|nr:MAG: hypothetical protein AMS19_07925 [Gemmatimonas sp. SG8_23]